MHRNDKRWERPEHPVNDQQLQQLIDGGIFAHEDQVSLSPFGIVVDERTSQPYAFSSKQTVRAAQLGVRIKPGVAWEYEEYFDHQGQPQLRDSIVCQLDVLGTARESDADVAEHLRITRSAIASAQRWAHEGIEITARWFTDNAAIAALDDGWRAEFSLSTIALVCAAMQLELAGHGRFSRGGIAAGPFHASELFAYGAPLVEAYKLESRVAVYPRAVFSEALKQRLRTDLDLGSILDAVVAVDHDGMAFVSYLGPLTDPQSDKDPIETLAAHRNVVLRELANESHPEGVKAKYGWAADYHDRFCRRWFAEADVRIQNGDGPALVCIGDES